VPVTYRLLGPLEALVDGRSARLGGNRPRAVLAVLLLRANQVVPTQALIDAVWGDDPPTTAENLIQGYVSGLRKELGREAIETSEPGTGCGSTRMRSICAGSNGSPLTAARH
jgi:DNA-binding SARP family transcriptional activator